MRGIGLCARKELVCDEKDEMRTKRTSWCIAIHQNGQIVAGVMGLGTGAESRQRRSSWRGAEKKGKTEEHTQSLYKPTRRL
jgi:hypothetical protein